MHAGIDLGLHGCFHAGIRQLQFILLKVCLIFGCNIYYGTTMKEIVPPCGPGDGYGWGITLDPPDHPASKLFYNVIVGKMMVISFIFFLTILLVN